MDEIKKTRQKRSVVVDMNTFVSRVKKHMTQKGITASELADRADLARSALSLFLSGERKPSMDALAKLADVLDASTDFLLCRAEESEIADLLGHDKVSELARLFIQLPSREQDQVVKMVRLMVRDLGTSQEEA